MGSPILSQYHQLDGTVDLELMSTLPHIKPPSFQAPSLNPTALLDVSLHLSEAASKVKLTLNLDTNHVLKGSRLELGMVSNIQSGRDLLGRLRSTKRQVA
jgi:hypothetical protein